MFNVKELLDPNQAFMKSQGFKPNFIIRVIRFLSKILIKLLFLSGKTRWSNEFIQQLNPQMIVSAKFFDIKSKKKLWFRTGHEDYIGE